MGDRNQGRRLKVLVLSRNYPNNVTELLGLWVERLVRHSTSFCEPTVIAPVPYCPPLGLPEKFSRFRRVKRQYRSEAVEVLHPRFAAGPGYSLYNFESHLYFLAVQRAVARLWRAGGFDLIHAHFTYPDGVVAARLGERYGVPVIITEHVPWDAWENYPRVRRQVIEALGKSRCHISVSRSARASVERYAGPRDNLTIIPNGVDGSLFRPADDPAPRVANQIVFVGAVRPIKGVDVLLRAVRCLKEWNRDTNLVIAGEAFYGGYQKEEDRLRRLTAELGLNERVHFIGRQSPAEAAALMARSAALVLPSRLESFGSVLVEALACGTPVVATRCGGPEDIVTGKTGVLTPVDDPEGLAKGIAHVLDHQAEYDPLELRQYALENFSLESVGRRMANVYEEAVKQFGSRPAVAAAQALGGSLAS